MINGTPNFAYEGNRTTAILIVDDIAFTGTANCNQADTYSRRAGERIAYFKAFIKVMKHIRKVDLKPKYEILHHICDIYEKNPQKYSIKSEEVQLVRRQLKLVENDIASANWIIKDALEQIDLIDKMYNSGQDKE